MCVLFGVGFFFFFFLGGGGGGGEAVGRNSVCRHRLSACLRVCFFVSVHRCVYIYICLCLSKCPSVYMSLCMYVSLCVSLSLSLGLYRNCQLAAGPNTERPAENGPTKLPVCAVRRPAIQRFIHDPHRLSISSLELPVATYTSSSATMCVWRTCLLPFPISSLELPVAAFTSQSATMCVCVCVAYLSASSFDQ